MHHQEFGRIWNDFLTGGNAVDLGDSHVLEAAAVDHQPYVPRVTVYPDGEGVIEVEAIDFPAEALALEFGEFLYQLRAALDSLVYETASAVTGEDPPPGAEDLEFPIRSSEQGFKGASRKIAPLTDRHKTWIADLQPYRTEYETDGMAFTARALNAINDLARKDRHRGLRVVASWGANKNPQFDLPAGCSLEWVRVTDDGLLEHESEIARFKIRNWKSEHQISANPNFTVDVAVEDLPPPADDDDTLLKRTRGWFVVVKLLIEGFEKSLDE